MLFCTGIGVGFFVFGVTEPLYYYRQPTNWKSWNYDYNFNKPGFHDDDQRANQAIFVSFFHWGLHGWIPYITPTILLGLCSHRYGLPMGIRTCFFPLLGNHVFGLFGDIIDGISIACTTFGVCTSLGLGVMQIGQFYSSMELEFNNNAMTVETDGQIGIILAITGAATVSVVLGMDRGLTVFSYFAMALAFLILLPVFFADNSMYLANVIVQGMGYYIQHFIQVGFDCEAFQQLSFEFQDAGGMNEFWGASYSNLQGKLEDVNVSAFGTPMDTLAHAQVASNNLKIQNTGNDCGAQVNPCNVGMIFGPIALLSTKYLTSVGMSPVDAMRAFKIASDIQKGTLPWSTVAVPCGHANTTNLDETTAKMVGMKVGDGLPEGFTWPSTCPTTTFDDAGSWGTCSSYKYYKCYASQAYFGSTNPQFMDWWTVFYWAWWISWAPFFGVFVGTVSRGRTIRMTVIGGFLAPLLLIMLWFGVFGGLAIKMERVAELALGVKPDWKHGTIECGDHYSGGNPSSAEAKALESIGYYMIACRPPLKQFFDVLMPYAPLYRLLWPVSFIALLVWFITSSDSGSYVDDLLGSSGLSNPPIIQKIYWCWTEGTCAIALLKGGTRDSALKALRSASICAGFAENLFICFFCTAIYRLVKFDAKDEDIMKSKRFNTQLFDAFTLFQPIKTKYSKQADYLFTPVQCVIEIVVACFVPGYTAFVAAKAMYGPIASALVALVAQVLWLAFFTLQIAEVDKSVMGIYALAWTFYMFFIGIITAMRAHMRAKYTIWGSMPEDFFIALTIPPFALAQMKMQAEKDGAGMRGYFQDLEELVEYDAIHGTSGMGGAKTRTADDVEAKPAVATAVSVEAISTSQA